MGKCVKILTIQRVLIACPTATGGYRLQSSHQLWMEIKKQEEYKQEFLAEWRRLELDLCIAPCFAAPAPLSKDIGRLVGKILSYSCS